MARFVVSDLVITDGVISTSITVSSGLALSGFTAVSTNGLIVRTAANTYAARTITGTSGQVTVTNGDGAAGAPTISLQVATSADADTDALKALTISEFLRRQAPYRNALAPARGLVFDGTTPISLISIPAFGTSGFTVAPVANFASLASAPSILDATNSIAFYVSAAGALTVYDRVGGAPIFASAAGVIAAGTAYAIAYSRGIGVFVNGSNISGAVADASNYTGTAYKLGADNAGTSNLFSGTIRALIYNRALTAAEVLALYQSGAPSASDYYGSGVNTAISAGSFVVGKRYRVSSAGTTDFTLIGAANSSVGTEFVATGVGSGSGTATALGLLLAPEANAPGNGYQWRDASGNKADITLPTSGVTWVLPDAKLNRVRTSTSTNGNQQASGQVLIPAPSQITRIRARSLTGTPTITLGTASGGSQLVASVALTTTWKDLTIALTGGIVSAASSIWVGSNSTDVVETDVSYEPLNT